MANETSWLGQKLWYVVLSALGATVAGGLTFICQYVFYGGPAKDALLATWVYGMFIGMFVTATALFIAYPIYWFVLPPRSIIYSAAIGFGSGAAIMLIWTIWAISAGNSRGRGPTVYLTWDSVGFMMWAGVCGAVFMAVLAWLTNRGLRTQADAAPHGGGDEAAS